MTKLLFLITKSIFVEFDEPIKAYYLCGLLTGSHVQRYISSFHIMLQIGEIFKHMCLPEFDSSNDQHLHLAELTQAAHNEADPGRKSTLLTQISEVANHIIELWMPQD